MVFANVLPSAFGEIFFHRQASSRWRSGTTRSHAADPPDYRLLGPLMARDGDAQMARRKAVKLAVRR